MLGHEANFRIVAGVTSIKTIRSLGWAVKMSLIKKVKEISNF